MTTLVERLRRLALHHYVEPGDPSICEVAADALEARDELLQKVREAVASLPEDALGFDDRQNYLCDPHPPYPLRNELLSEIDAALKENPQG